MIDVYLYALNEEDESMREQYSASPSVIVFCHSEHEGDDQDVLFMIFVQTKHDKLVFGGFYPSVSK